MPSRLRLPSSNAARAACAGLVAAGALATGLQLADAGGGAHDNDTQWPIKHVVVLFQENTSFDHVFGTYPNAVNGPGEVPFTYTPNGPAPTVDNYVATPSLLTANPNAGNPQRTAPSDVIPTIGCANNHGYTAEQMAFDGGLMDKFKENTQGGGCAGTGVMNYVDGNTVGALWNYANHYAMSDNHHGSGFGPSTIGAIQLVSGNTSTAVDAGGAPANVPGAVDNGTVYSNANPFTSLDGCSSSGGYAMSMQTGPGNTSKNVGDLLNAAGVSWGWFQGGFAPTSRLAPTVQFPDGQPVCGSSHKNVAGAVQGDYDPHHNPFSYYKSTSNPEHLPPTGPIGLTDQANHNYDLSYFDEAVTDGTLPAVSFVKASHYQDGHPGYSDPIDEQQFLVDKINAIQKSPLWNSTAIFIAWDDSDGWYDHKFSPIVRASATAEDALDGAGTCGTPGGAVVLRNGRCGYGPRLPLLAISPFAHANYVKHTVNDQAAILRFIEDNWSLGRISADSADNDVADGSKLNSMFDLSGGPGANTALVLNPSTGALPGVTPAPTLAPAATPTPTPAPAPTATPAPVLPAAVLSKLSAKTSKKGAKKVALTLSVKSAPAFKTSLRVRLYKGKALLGTSSSVTLKTVKKKTSATTSISTKKALSRGKYSLVVTISQPARNPVTQTLSLKL